VREPVSIFLAVKNRENGTTEVQVHNLSSSKDMELKPATYGESVT